MPGKRRPKNLFGFSCAYLVINTMKNASLKIGANHEHDTQAMRPTDRNDLFYYLALSFEK